MSISKDDWTMNIYPPDSRGSSTPSASSANPAPRRANFATSAAQVEFGHAYVPPEYAGFVDRTPDEVRAARESLCVVVAR